jgi:hypothetical protein
LFLAGCGAESGKAPAKKLEKPPEPVGGQVAAFRMYGVARQWAQDALLLRMESFAIPEVPSEGGKSGAWRAIFVSPQIGGQREYSYSVVESKEINLRSGVFAQQPGTYTASPQLKPFLMAALRVDSTVAYETAVKESAEYIKKNPDKPVQFELSFTPQTPNAAWRVVWGQSIGTSDYSIYIDASTGFFMRRSR